MPLRRLSAADWLGVLFLLLTGWVPLSTAPAANPPRFTHLTTREGLSNNWAYASKRDSKGFLWVATANGLNRYDGSVFRHYHAEAGNPASLSSSNLYSVYEDSQGDIWVVASYHAVNLYIPSEDAFVQIPIVLPTAPDQVPVLRGIEEVSPGVIWVAVENYGVAEIDKRGLRVHLISGLIDPSVPFNTVRGIFRDNASGKVWLGTGGASITRYDPNSRKFELFTLPDYPKNTVGAMGTAKLIMVDRKGCVWTTSDATPYVWCLDPESGATKRFRVKADGTGLNYPLVKDFVDVDADTVWIATDNGGINAYNRVTGRFTYIQQNIADPYSLSSNGLYDIELDSQGILWISTFDGGVSCFNPRNTQFDHLYHIPGDSDSLAHNNVTRITQDRLGTVWIGSDGGGLHEMDEVRRSIRRIEPQYPKRGAIDSPYVTALHSASDGSVWIASFEEGISVLRPDTGELWHMRMSEYPGLRSNNIWSIGETLDGRMLVGSSEMMVWDPQSQAISLLADEESSRHFSGANNVTSILVSRSGIIWWGNLMSGLSRYDPHRKTLAQFHHIQDDPNSVPSDHITFVTEGPDGRIWLGSTEGLSWLDPNTLRIHHLSPGIGLSGVMVNGIAIDLNGVLWLSSKLGISRYDPASSSIQHFRPNHALHGWECTRSNAMVSQSGRVYFGGVFGLLSFFPDEIKQSDYVPHIAFTNFEVMNRSVKAPTPDGPRHIDTADPVRLDPSERTFSLTFSALDITRPEGVSYKYRLLPYDQEWIVTGSRYNKAVYTSVPGGTYQFEIQSTNGDGVWVQNTRRLHIQIVPPFWQRWSFRLSATVLLLGIFSLVFWLRILAINRQKALLASEVEEKTSELLQRNHKLEEQHITILTQKKKLEDLGNTLQRQVAERTEELSLAKDRLERADQIKGAFLANLSHELRTPLNAIIGLLDQFEDPDLPSDERKRLKSHVYESSDDLLNLIGDILDLSSMESNALHLNPETLDLPILIHDIHGHWESTLKSQESPLSLILEPEPIPMILNADRTRLRQVFSHLIGNAVKFTHEGSVRMGYRLENDSVRFEVKDTGIGIPREQMSNLFVPFGKIDPGSGRVYGGTGLGLAICQRIVHQMGGHLTCESKPGVGSTFAFTLPRPAGEPSEVTPAVPGFCDIPDFSDFVLVVAEDDALNRKVIATLLAKTKASLLWAEDGQQLVDLIARTPTAHLVLTDIKMPVMDGLEATRHLRAMGYSHPVVAQTAFAMTGDKEKAMKAGCNAYLTKPLRKQELYTVLDRLLNP